MSARESDNASAASDEEQCSVTARPAAIRAARRRAICEPFTECLLGIAAAGTKVELEGEKLFGSIFRLVRSFSIALVDDIVAWCQARGAIGRPVLASAASSRHLAERLLHDLASCHTPRAAERSRAPESYTAWSAPAGRGLQIGRGTSRVRPKGTTRALSLRP